MTTKNTQKSLYGKLQSWVRLKYLELAVLFTLALSLFGIRRGVDLNKYKEVYKNPPTSATRFGEEKGIPVAWFTKKRGEASAALRGKNGSIVVLTKSPGQHYYQPFEARRWYGTTKSHDQLYEDLKNSRTNHAFEVMGENQGKTEATPTPVISDADLKSIWPTAPDVSEVFETK